ncbi:MAG TPA: GntR family transcriptional regulator [Bryobacteraceae bacterium]|nr:GntR family transcriptional regulator [Bryobacteraceae bacterium]
MEIRPLEGKTRGAPIEEPSQTVRALLSLREMLLHGAFRPGERISELPLVSRLGVSRTPIRLALDRLANEGLLEASPSGGFTVRAFTLEDIWDAIEMRGVLEGTAARLAAERLASDRDLEPLRKCRDEMASVLSPPTMESFAQYLELNEAFHSAMIDLANSPMLRRTLERVLSLPFASPSALVFAPTLLPGANEMLVLGQEHHCAIVESIENRQGTRAESLAREHSRLARRNLETALANKDIFSSVPGSSLIRVV